jgi:hypothetical protein
MKGHHIMPHHDDRASALDDLFPPDGPALLLTADGNVVGRQSAAEEMILRALRGCRMLADDLGESHFAMHQVTELGGRLERAQGRLTRFQMCVLLALYRCAVELPGDDTRPTIMPIGLSPDYETQYRAACGAGRDLDDLFQALVVSPVRPSIGGRMH